MVCNSILDLYKSYDSFLLDMYGVLYSGSALYDNTLETLSQIKKEGKRIIILSNTTLVSQIARSKYEKLGLLQGVHYDEFITSGEVFKKKLEKEIINGWSSYHQIFSPNREIFDSINLTENASIKYADFIYVGAVKLNNQPINLHNVSTYDNYPINIDELFEHDWNSLRYLDIIKKTLDECLKYNKKLLVANPDIFAIEKIDGVNSPVVCQGSIGEYYERMDGEVLYFGKPYPEIYNYAQQFTEGKTVMVGDTPWTDILGGNMAGIDTVLTLTGVSNHFISQSSEELSDITAISTLLGNISKKMTHKNLRAFKNTPTHIIKQFAGRN